MCHYFLDTQHEIILNVLLTLNAKTTFITFTKTPCKKDFPSGVVSKKDMGERMMRMSMVLCSLVAAFSVKMAKKEVATMMEADCIGRWKLGNDPLFCFLKLSYYMSRK